MNSVPASTLLAVRCRQFGHENGPSMGLRIRGQLWDGQLDLIRTGSGILGTVFRPTVTLPTVSERLIVAWPMFVVQSLMVGSMVVVCIFVKNTNDSTSTVFSYVADAIKTEIHTNQNRSIPIGFISK